MVRRERVAGAAALLAVFLACKPSAPQQGKRSAAAEPQTRATVVTIQTTIQPGNKTTTHTLVVANGRARSGDEVDAWRLFDLANDRVTFVDDVAKTFRSVATKQLVKGRRGALADPLPDDLPRAQFVSTGARKPLQGVMATQSVVRLGGYTRELWIAEHPLIPPQLYAMMIASQSPSSPLVPVMKPVDEALLNVRGFPLAEHSELAYGNKKMTVDKQVVKIEQRNVPASWLNVQRDYKELPSFEAAGAARPANRSH